MEDFYPQIGNRISQLRKERGMTQETLAERLDVTVKHISAVERGISSLSLEKMVDVSRIFDCTMDYLILGAEYGMILDMLPPSVLDILKSGDSEEISLLIEYLSLYMKIRHKD